MFKALPRCIFFNCRVVSIGIGIECFVLAAANQLAAWYVVAIAALAVWGHSKKPHPSSFALLPVMQNICSLILQMSWMSCIYRRGDIYRPTALHIRTVRANIDPPHTDRNIWIDLPLPFSSLSFNLEKYRGKTISFTFSVSEVSSGEIWLSFSFCLPVQFIFSNFIGTMVQDFGN